MSTSDQSRKERDGTSGVRLAETHGRQYQDLFESAPDGYVVTDLNGIILQANRAAGAMLRTEPHRLAGSRLDLYMDADAHSAFAARLRDAQRSAQAELWEVRLKPCAGKAVHARLSYAVERRDGVRPLTVRWMFRDITDRRAAERKYAAILETVQSGFWLFDLQGRLLEVNEAYCHMSGYNRQELLGMNIGDLEATQSRRQVIEHICFVRRCGHRQFESRHRRKDGAIMDVDIRASYLDVEGGRVAVFVWDITRRKQAEALDRAINATHGVIHSTRDFDQIMLGALPVATKALGCDSAAVSLRDGDHWVVRHVYGLPDEIIGASMSDNDEPHAVMAVKSRRPIAIDDAFNDPRVNREHMRRWGIRSVLVTPLVLREHVVGVLFFNYCQSAFKFIRIHTDFAAELGSAIALALDNAQLFASLNAELAEHKLTEERLRAAKAAAESANAAKDKFLAALSHELRTPLTPVLMLSRQLEDDPSVSKDVREDAKTIRQNVQLEARLIDDLLDLTRIARGKIQHKPEPVNIHEMLDQALQACSDEQFNAKRLRLAWQLAAGSTTVSADPTRLRQVFWNLMRNAIKFTPPDGTITIRTANPASCRIVIEIADTGTGIDAARLTTIFNPFEQGGIETTRQFGGLGLGLAIAKTIVEIHGGQISAASEGLGRGATFSVELTTIESPALAEDASPVAPLVEDAALTAVAPRILLVEDHPPTALVLGRLLKKSGWEISIAASIKSALNLAAEGSFDVVISDLGLPDGSGHDLMRRLRDAYGLKGIALSGYGMEQDIQNSLAAGFHLHLTKPLNFEDLRSAVAGLLSNDTANPQ